MKNGENGDVVVSTEIDAIVNDRGLLTGPRPSIDRSALEHHLREVLRALHVDMEDENIVDTPRR